MRHVLIIAYYFPPLGGIGSVRMHSFATHLPAQGWQVTVLAPATNAHFVDPDLRFAEDRVVRSRSLEISRFGRTALRVGRNTTAAPLPGWRGVVRDAARRCMYFPDGQIGWYLPGLRAGKDAIRHATFDAIFSSAFPVTAHLIARRLHRASGVPWIAEYRDPFSDILPRGSINRRRAEAIERSVAREAAALVMTSPTNAERHSLRWNRPISVIGNGCDGAVRARPPRDDRFVLAHLGSLYPEWQNLTGLWEAVRRLDGADKPQQLRLCFIGEPQTQVRDELRAYGLASRTDITGLMPHTEATARLLEADALLIAGPKDGRPELRCWRPGKLFEYLATDLPIIYVGDPDTDTARLLHTHPGCYVVDCHDVTQLTVTIQRCKGERHVRDVSDFTRPAMATKLSAVLDSVVHDTDLASAPDACHRL